MSPDRKMPPGSGQYLFEETAYRHGLIPVFLPWLPVVPDGGAGHPPKAAPPRAGVVACFWDYRLLDVCSDIAFMG